MAARGSRPAYLSDRVSVKFGGGVGLLSGGMCARAPGLTSVRDQGVGSRAGDMMFDGVIPLGVSVAAARSFWAVHGVAAAGLRELAAAHLCD